MDSGKAPVKFAKVISVLGRTGMWNISCLPACSYATVVVPVRLCVALVWGLERRKRTETGDWSNREQIGREAELYYYISGSGSD